MEGRRSLRREVGGTLEVRPPQAATLEGGCLGIQATSGRGVPWVGPADAPAWKFYRVHSFLDYIMGGCQIHFTVRARDPHSPPRHTEPGRPPQCPQGRRMGVHVRMWVD